MLRSMGAVIGSLAAIMLLVVVGSMAAVAVLASPGGGVTVPYLIANLAVSVGAAVAGGWLAGRVASHRPMAHAAAVAGLLILLSVPGLGAPAAGQPAWYPAVVLALGVTGVLSGAWLHGRS